MPHTTKGKTHRLETRANRHTTRRHSRDLAKWLGHLDAAAEDFKSAGRHLKAFAFPDFEEFREIEECEVIYLFGGSPEPEPIRYLPVKLSDVETLTLLARSIAIALNSTPRAA